MSGTVHDLCRPWPAGSSAIVTVLPIADTCGDDEDVVWQSVLTLIHADELDAARAHCLRLARRGTSIRLAQMVRLLQARISWLSGDLADAETTLRALLTERIDQCMALAWLVEVLVQLGERDQAADLLFDSPAGRAAARDPDYHWLAARAALHMAIGRFDAGTDDYLHCGQQLARWNVENPAVLPWRSRAALGALRTQHVALAVTLAEQELAAAKRWGTSRAIGVALHAFAMTWDGDRRVELLDEAVGLLSRSRACVELMQALLDLGGARLSLGELDRARMSFESARQLAEQSRNAHWAKRAEHGIRQATLPDARLTAQECKIASLARAGHSNPQIAEDLYLARRTVEFHLSSVYRKLGISGRQELLTAVSPQLLS